MKHVAALLLLKLGGNQSPSQDDISKLLACCGGETDAESMTVLFEGLDGKNIDKLIEAGRDKLCIVGGGSGGAAPAQAGDAGNAEEAAVEEKEETEEEESSAAAGGMFGGSSSDDDDSDSDSDSS